MDEKAPENKEGEMKEKKEKFLNVGKKKESNSSFPVYLLGMMLVLGLLVGYGISIAMQPQAPEGNENPDTNTINDLGYRTVEITMLYSSECEACRQTNTIEELFKVREIPYTMEKVDTASEEGKLLLSRYYLIETVPTAIIHSEKMAFYPTTKSQFDNVLQEQNGDYLAPEMNLNENFYFPYYFLNKVGGLCSSQEPTVIHLNDYYTEETSKQRSAIYDLFTDFNRSVDLKYVFTQADSTDENAVLANLFLMCAGEQGKYPDFEKAMTGIYCNNPFKGDETILTGPEILGCWTLGEHYGTPLTQFELDVALGRTDIDENAFLECISRKSILLNNAKNIAEEIGITKIPPGGVFLVDCAETASIDTVKETLCARHPELENCGSAE